MVVNIVFHLSNPVCLTVSLQTESQLAICTLTTCLSNMASIVSEISLLGIRGEALDYVLDKPSFSSSSESHLHCSLGCSKKILFHAWC